METHFYSASDLGKPRYSRCKMKQHENGEGQEGTSQRASKKDKGGASLTRKGKMVKVKEVLEDNTSEEGKLEANLSKED